MSDNNNKSLYIYTALIFVVALVLIIISFFGQSKLAQNQPIPISQEEVSSITERAAVVSNENKVLLEENIFLKQELEKTKTESVSLKAQNELYKQKSDTIKLLLSANGYCSMKMYREALLALENIDVQTLSDDEKLLYDNIKKTAENSGK